MQSRPEKVARPEIRFLMRLALRLGRTLSELRHSLSASEAMMWMVLTGYPRWVMSAGYP